MPTLSERDCDIIASHPLGSALDHLRKPLQDAEQSISDSRDSATDSVNSRQKSISRLLSALLGAEAAFKLRLKTSSRVVASELSDLFKHVLNSDFNYDHYRPLARLIIQKASDSEIWSAVLDLIAAFSRVAQSEILRPIM
jgi:hypothetical protein